VEKVSREQIVETVSEGHINAARKGYSGFFERFETKYNENCRTREEEEPLKQETPAAPSLPG